MGIVYHVAKTGSDNNIGLADAPFLTIQKAANEAIAGDTVIVHEGTYREWVKPQNSGISEYMRITYKAADNEKVVIKGSERITCWGKVEGTLWKAVLPNSFFGDLNPYTDNLLGDWFYFPDKGYETGFSLVHTGEVYLNGKSFYEAMSFDEVRLGEIRERGGKWNAPMRFPQDTKFKWFAEVDDRNTTVYGNFHEFNPNEELVEINVRRSCFYPMTSGLNYITVSGFEMAHGACNFTPPSADQPAIIGPNWAKGWIIENNIIHDAKCSGLSLGKEKSTGHNECTYNKFYSGFNGQLESVFRALQKGWSRDTIGSHIVRNNVIYDCGQNGIVGHMGCVFSEIYNNHIYNIGIKAEFNGAEIGGIKLHAPIDVYIHNNCIHDTTLAMWLDWQTQGTRVSANVFYKNSRDLVVEVCHGPHLFDNNILASNSGHCAFLSQGGACVNNLICSAYRTADVLDRFTPYHLPHSTEVLGCAMIYSKDDRWYNNIFVGGAEVKDNNKEDANGQKIEILYGTKGYNGCPDSFEEYQEALIKKGPNLIDTYTDIPQPAYINANAYYNGAECYEKEKENFITKDNADIKITTEEDGVYLEITIDERMLGVNSQIMHTGNLGMARVAREHFEDKNGEAIFIDVDYFGNSRSEKPVCGPFENIKAGYNKLKVFSF